MVAVKKTLWLDRSFRQTMRSRVLLQHVACSSSASKKKKNRNPQHKKSDIWSFFHVTSIVSNTPRKDDANTGIVCKTITIDD